jgi:ketol-acid reductoisomerase
MQPTPDKQHSGCNSHNAIDEKVYASLFHGFNIVEEGMQIRKDITVYVL